MFTTRSTLDIDFKDHYVIKPSIKFYDININYLKNALNEVGKSVKEDFEYRSDNNEHFLNIKEISDINESLN